MALYKFGIEYGARYKLVGPDGSTAVFNDPQDPNYVGALTEVTGLDSPEIRESAQDLVQGDGGVHGDFYYGRRPIVLNGTVFGHATVAARNARLSLARLASNCMRADGSLTWKPSTRIENWITNPRFKIDTSGWVNNLPSGLLNSGATITRDTNTNPLFGDAGAGNVAVTTAQTGAGFQITNPDGPWVAGKTYTAYITARTTGADRAVRLLLGSAADNVLTAEQTATNTTNGALLSVSWTPSSTTSAAVYLAIRSSGTNYTDTIRILRSRVAGANESTSYIDGDMQSGWWSSGAHASWSGNFVELYVPVRRQQPFRESGAWNKTFQIPLVCQYAAIFSAASKTLTGGTSVSPVNNGTGSTFPLVKITGAAGNPTINGTGGNMFTTGLILAAGRYITFDLLNHTATWDDGTAASQYIDYLATASWPYIYPSSNGFSTSSGTIEVTWRDVWI